MLPDVLTQPRAAHLKDSPFGLAGNRTNRAPYVRVVMCHPPACAIKFRGHVRAIHADLACEFEQRQMTFGKIRRFDRPVIDLRVAVDGPVRRPRRK